MLNHALMPPYCTSSRLTRRQFLLGMLGLGGLLLLNSEKASAAPASPPMPVWWQSLHDQQIHAPAGITPPYGMPGSIMKLIATIALQEERLIDPEETLECRGILDINGIRYRCQQAHGAVNLTQALGLSCNLYFAQAAERLSTARFLRYAEQFGLHRPIGKHPFQFPSRQSALNLSSPYALGLADDLQPNALHLLNLSQKIAQRKIPELQPATWKLLQNGMRLCVRQGTGRLLDPLDQWRVAAKTGTTPHGHSYQSWLIGYFPVEAPRYAFCLRANAGTAKDIAVPLMRQFLLSRTWQ